MKNNKGQALVEFILILPLLMILLFAIIEFGNMIHQKYILETYIETSIDFYQNKKNEILESMEKKENININFKESGNMVTVVITKKIKLITPGLNLVFDNPYELKTERTFYVDKDTSIPTATEVPLEINDEG